MIYPIVAYGDAVLRKVATDVDMNWPELPAFIESMYETMYHTNGVGLAAPQVGKSIRLFVIDSHPMYEDEPKDDGIKRVFINPKRMEESGDEWPYEEGCLSIPGIREDVMRKPVIQLQYLTEDGETRIERFEGMNARVIQHEYDHLEGILFTDLISPFRKRIIQSKLNNIRAGKTDVRYRMRFARK